MGLSLIASDGPLIATELGVEMGFLKSERILTQDIPMHRAHNGHLGNVRHMLWHDLERK